MAVLHTFTSSWDTVPFSTVLLIIGGAALAYLIAFPARLDDREPPLVRPAIPFIGHVYGLLRHSYDYHRALFRNHGLPICTLPMFPSGKLYVITSPALAASAIRARTMSFEPHVTEFIASMTDADAETLRVYRDPAFFAQWIKIVYSGLTAGHLGRVNSSALDMVTRHLNEIPEAGLRVEDVMMWTRNIMTVASTTGLLGGMNPWRKDPSLVDSYWDFERDILKMMLKIPSDGAKGRARIQAALTEYFTANHDKHDDVPMFTRDRYALARAGGLQPAQMASIEVALLHAALTNTIPTAFWVLTYVYSNPALVEELREEAKALIAEDNGSAAGSRRTVRLNVMRLEEKCPLLYSAFQEVQRIISISVLNRHILEDTTVSDGKTEYLLKKGNVLMIASGITHKMEGPWGASVNAFDPRRFLKTAEKSVAPGAYTPFGGGRHICPGRYFASGEILGFVALLLLGFEVTDMAGGPVALPRMSTPWITSGLGQPTAGSDLGVKIRRRCGWESVEWDIVSPGEAP